MLSTNFQVSNYINFEFLSEICYANYENKFTIYSDGSIGKCTLKDTDNCGSGYVIGDIKKGFFDVDYKTLSAWLSLIHICVLSYNLYSYCENNPINNSDSNGNNIITDFLKKLINFNKKTKLLTISRSLIAGSIDLVLAVLDVYKRQNFR